MSVPENRVIYSSKDIDKIQDTRQQIEEYEYKIEQSKQNCRRMLNESLKYGAKSNKMLYKQEEQLKRITGQTHEIDADLKQAEKVVHKMRFQWWYCLFGCFCRSPKTNTLMYEDSLILDLSKSENNKNSQDICPTIPNDFKNKLQDLKENQELNSDDEFNKEIVEGIQTLKEMALEMGDTLDRQNVMVPQISDTLVYQFDKIKRLNRQMLSID